MFKKTNSFTILSSILAILVLLITACSITHSDFEDELLGKWTYTSNKDGNNAYFLNLEFTPDGKLLMGEDKKTIEYQVNSPGKITITYMGLSDELKYQLKGNELRIYFDDGFNAYTQTSSSTSSLNLDQTDQSASTNETTDEMMEEMVGKRQVITPENVFEMTEHIKIGKGIMNDIVQSPDGDLLAIASSMGIYLYKSKNMEEVLYIPYYDVKKIAYSSNNTTIASLSWDEKICLWNAKTGDLLSTLSNANGQINSIAFSIDGSFLASGNEDSTINLWNIETGDLIRTLEGHQDAVTAIAFSPDGFTLGSGSLDDSTRLWNFSTGAELHKFKDETDDVIHIAFSQNGNEIASSYHEYLDETESASSSRTIIWHVDNGIKLGKIAAGDSYLAFLDNNEKIATSRGIWEIKSGELIRNFVLENGYFYYPVKATLSQDEKYLISVNHNGILYKTKLATGLTSPLLEEEFGEIINFSFSLDGRSIVTASTDNTIRIWNTIDGSLIEIYKILNPKQFREPIFSVDGSLMAFTDFENNIHLWNAAKGKQLEIMKMPNGLYDIIFSPTGKILAAEDEKGSVWIIDINSWSIIHEIPTQLESIRSMAFSPDGEKIAIGYVDNSIIVWELDDFSIKYQLVGHNYSANSIAFSPDGNTLSSASLDMVILWDLTTGEILNHLEDANEIVSYSIDGSFLASGYKDTICLWDTSTSKPIHTLGWLSSWINLLKFSQDGKLLASQDDAGIIRLWHVLVDKTQKSDSQVDVHNVATMTLTKTPTNIPSFTPTSPTTPKVQDDKRIVDKFDPTAIVNWVKYVIEIKDASLLEDLISNEGVFYQNIHFVVSDIVKTKQEYLSDLQKNLIVQPKCEGIYIYNNLLVIFYKNWDPGWPDGWDPSSAAFDFELEPNGYRLHSMNLHSPVYYFNFALAAPYQVYSLISCDSLSLTEPTYVPSCPGSNPQRLEVGRQGKVCTLSDSLRLRKSPGTGGEIIASLKTGTTFEVIGGPECAGSNWSWWQVQLNDGQIGWLAEGGDKTDPYFLCPLD